LQAALAANARWWEGGGKAENLDDEQDVDTGARSNSTAVSKTCRAQNDKIQRRVGGKKNKSIA
jgi:hypothetical protein